MSMNRDVILAELADDSPVLATEALHEYILSGRNATGKNVTELVEASSADAAVEMLKQRGYTEIVTHTDDVGALFSQQKKIADLITPKEYIGLRERPHYWGRVALVTRKLYLQGWKFIAFLLLMLVVHWWMQLRWAVLFYSMAGVVLLFPLVIAILTQLGTRVLRDQRLLELVAWGRWNEALREIDGLHGLVPDQELLWTQAKALAGLGRLNDAIALVTPLANDAARPRWYYYSCLAEVYIVAEHRDEALECGDKALEFAPNNATLFVKKALMLLHCQTDIPRARQLLREARSHALSDVLSPAADAVEGMLLLEEGHPHQAREMLEAGLTGLGRFRAAMPLVGAMQDRFRAYLALSLAAIGERAEAERQFRQAEPRLRALKRAELLARCERAIGTLSQHPS